ncbi:MAG: hypothetical protein IKK33_08185 [Lachnospiraceae bacterium]|nr:hypothetical protein [Lachnospiraceae bacterium]
MENQRNKQEFISLTDYIPNLQSVDTGKWYPENQSGDGGVEKPFQMPFVVYSDVIRELEKEMYRFDKEHPQYNLKEYQSILEECGVSALEEFDVTNVEAKVVLALILCVFRTERFCDGAIKKFLENGRILKWLERLKEIDEAKTDQG